MNTIPLFQTHLIVLFILEIRNNADLPKKSVVSDRTSIKIHLRDLTLIVISRPGCHVARSKRSSLARIYAKGGDIVV